MEIRRSWYQRVVPVRVRHHMRLILGSLGILVIIGGLLGSLPLQPIIFSNGSSTIASSILNNIEGTVDLFDLSQPHSISIEMDDIDYQRLIKEFQGDGEKAWIAVNMTIDGTLLKSVGVRLKGNSTLMSLGGGGDAFSQERLFGEGEMPPWMQEWMEQAVLPDGFPAGGSGGLKAFNMSNASFDEPNTLPFLISFDEFVVGRGYQGRTQLALRSVEREGSNLNEALALQLIEDSTQISQKYTWVTYSVNGSSTTSRIVIENPDLNYAANLGRGAGVLYKSRSTNSFTYHGEDQSQYVNDFTQVNALGSRDYTPVIALLRWLESASDEAFDAELPSKVDIKSFAQYVVTHELLNNFDDMAGPGRNFLFWYDLDDEKFTVINWDMNLAISGMTGMFGGGGFPAGADGGFPFPPEGSGFGGFPGGAPGGFLVPETEAADLAEGEMLVAPPGGFPEGGLPFLGGEGFLGGFPEGEGFPEGMLRMGNDLKERFMASEAFADDIQQVREELQALWFDSGRAALLLEELSKSVPITDRLSQELLDADIESLSESILASTQFD